jgi:hypothetical protein
MRIRTLRGRVDALTVKRLIVDDGQFNHGMKVKEFHLWATSHGGSRDVEASLGLDFDLGATWDASDNRQIAWAAQTNSAAAGSEGSFQFSLIDPDHIVIKDLYINNFGANVANYMVILEPVTLSDDQAILQLIKERSQDDLR